MVKIAPRLQRTTKTQLFWGTIAMSIGFWLDYKYFSMCQDEMDTFMEKSRLYGNWRERNKRKPAIDAELMIE